MKTVDYTDEHGIHRRVLLPKDFDGDPAEGIPVSLDLTHLYPHMPPDFHAWLTEELWARGLVEPKDFLTPAAPELIRAALFGAVRQDTLSIMALAKEQQSHAR